MRLSRREFLKLTGATAAATATGGLAAARPLFAAEDSFPLHKKVGESPSICTFCSGGCGIIVGVENGKVVNIEGDPDHPFNRGALCSKGAATFQMSLPERRLQKVMYRAPGADKWEEKTWDWAIQQIADRVKKTRDAAFTEKAEDGTIVNRAEALAGLGGATTSNEEAYLWVKLQRALGMVYVEHQARI
jgi:formate dehydrogenase major subunit